MTVAELLAECHARRIDLQAHGGQVDIDAPAGALTPELLHRLRTHKAELVATLQAQDLPGCDLPGDGAPVAIGGRPDALQAHAADGSQDDHGDARQAHGDAGPANGSQDMAAAPHAMAGPAGPRTRPALPVAVEWPAATADLCLLLTVDDLPPVPFRLNRWTEVRDAGKFLRWLQADARDGPSGPRAFYGALQADLQDLQRFALQAADDRQRSEYQKGGTR